MESGPAIDKNGVLYLGSGKNLFAFATLGNEAELIMKGAKGREDKKDSPRIIKKEDHVIIGGVRLEIQDE